MINQEGIRKDAFLIWPAGRDSNPRSPESESGALSGYATGGNIFNYYITKNYFFNTKDELYNRFRYVCLLFILFEPRDNCPSHFSFFALLVSRNQEKERTEPGGP